MRDRAAYMRAELSSVEAAVSMRFTNQTTPQSRYNGIEAQRMAILQRLTKGPATVEQLSIDCNAPDPRARVHELRADGYQIKTHMIDRSNPDSSVNRVGLYVLNVADTRQRELNFGQ